MKRDSAVVRIIVASTFGALACLCALAVGSEWTIDAAHSTVRFKVRHMMVSNVEGTFSDVKGTFDIPDKDLTKMKAEATIGVASVSTNQEKRDAHLKSPDFFDAAKFPTMTFKSSKVTKKGKKMEMKGDLTMHGVTKPVTLEVDEVTDAVKDMQGNPRRGFSASTEINRKDFGLTWNHALETGGVAVGEKVGVTLNFELAEAKKEEPKKEGATPEAKPKS
jgi:polyisoprenoid-binding protein YceI